MDKSSVSKDTLLRRADALLGEARRARKLSAAQVVEDERVRLIERAEDLERQAGRLEHDAVAAKSGVLANPLQRPGSNRSGGAFGAGPERESLPELLRRVADRDDDPAKPGAGRRRPVDS